MKLNRIGIADPKPWEQAGIKLPRFDIDKMVQNTKKAPRWIHFGTGNLFRAFHAVAMQNLLDEGLVDTGIVACKTFDGDTLDTIFTAYDNLNIVSILSEDGQAHHRVIASIAEVLRLDGQRPEHLANLFERFEAPSLQMVSFTITEKGYEVKDADGQPLPIIQEDIAGGPDKPVSTLGIATAGLYRRYLKGQKPVAMVSTDNAAMNGDKLHAAVRYIAENWVQQHGLPQGFLDYIDNKNLVGFPVTMIDKITPRPDPAVEKMLADLGVEGMTPVKTDKGSFIAPFVNAETTEYLVIEDAFPAGRPPLEKAGVYFTDRKTVNRVERMKVSTCLNPLHTALAVLGCLLGYNRIYEEMRDEDLVKLVKRIAYVEGMPVVTNPGIIDPKAFADEVINKRFPNPFIPDAPQRIATDTSKKLGVRFGETIRMYGEKGLDSSHLVAIPFVLAAWLRYLVGKDDNLDELKLSSDPKLAEVQPLVQKFAFGDTITAEQLRPILSMTDIFGADLYKAGLADRIAQYFTRMMAGKGAIRATLHEVANTKGY